MKRILIRTIAALAAMTSLSGFALACSEGETTTISGKSYTCHCNTLSNGQKICAFS
jgi:hypothetical protein